MSLDDLSHEELKELIAEMKENNRNYRHNLLARYDIKYSQESRSFHLLDYEKAHEGENAYIVCTLSKEFLILIFNWFNECKILNLSQEKVEEILQAMHMMAKIASTTPVKEEKEKADVKKATWSKIAASRAKSGP